MTQYEVTNAAERVEGYFIPRPGEPTEKAFARAQHEAVTNLKAAAAQTEALTFEQWKAAQRK